MRRSRRSENALNPWPGYVDALSTLLMVIIFVLLVFVLAQGFLSVAISSRDRALDRLNAQVAELAELLALERGQAEDLRSLLTRSDTGLRQALAARDALTALVGAARADLTATAAQRDAALAQATSLSARLSDLEGAARGSGQRLTGLESQLAEALTRAEAATGDAAQQLRRLNETGRALAAETQTRSAAQRQAQDTAAALAAERGARGTAEARGATLDRQIAESTTALAAERAARSQAETRGATLDRQLAETRGAAETARQELTTLRRQIAEAMAALANADRQLAALRTEMATLNQTVRADRATLEARLSDLARLTEDTQRLTALREILERDIRAEQARRGTAEGQAAEQTRLSEAARAQIALLTRQIEELRGQLNRLANTLDASESRDRESDVQITTLRTQLNAALAARVEELTRYRSDFFGRLRVVLGDRADVRIVGDRFVFQSEVLFPPASAELSVNGDRQIRELSRVLVDIAARIPPEIAWVLRVDGHADRNPIRSSRYASNWELSAARAIAVGNLLIQEGLPANRVAAAAFGEHQPLDTTDTPEAFARNRRIELRLTDR